MTTQTPLMTKVVTIKLHIKTHIITRFMCDNIYIDKRHRKGTIFIIDVDFGPAILQMVWFFLTIKYQQDSS